MDAEPIEPTARPVASDEALNLKQVARLLDVHYMTVYRYVRHGRLPARREGAIWLVDAADVEAFRSETASSADDAPADAVDWASRLAPALAAGDEVGAWTVIRNALGGGRDFSSVHLEVIGGALGLVSAGVHDGTRTPVHERVAVGVASRLVSRLGGQFPHRGRRLGTVVLAAPPGEYHALPLELVANLIRHAGFTVVELGIDTPGDDLLEAIATADQLIAVGIGVTTVDRLAAAIELIGTVRAVHPSLPVLLGGQAVRNPEIAELAGATSWAAGPDLISTLTDLIADRRASARRATTEQQRAATTGAGSGRQVR